jgi:metal-sulfur cluster biosynthetic enzyme
VVRITMTTTTPGCPAAGYLKEGVANGTWSVTGVEFVDVRITFEPAWKPDMMTVQARTTWDLRLAIDMKMPRNAQSVMTGDDGAVLGENGEIAE